MSVDDYQQTGAAAAAVKPTDPMTDTALRRIKVGRVYRYSAEIYNAVLDAAKKPDIETRIRVFREGKLILDGQPKPFDAMGQIDPTRFRLMGGLAIGTQMEPGDYVLQIIVRDKLGKSKQQIAAQYEQFEVVAQ